MPVRTSRDDGLPIERQIDEIGRRLQAQRGTQPIPKPEIDREVRRITGLKPGTRAFPLPSDRCWNWIKADPISFEHRVFLRTDSGQFRYVGPDHRYTGPVHWQPGGRPLQVGECREGAPRLEFDPRVCTPDERAEFLRDVDRSCLTPALLKWKPLIDGRRSSGGQD